MNTPIKPLRLLGVILLTSLFFACSPSPKDYGRMMAGKECQCDQLRLDLDMKKTKQMIEDLKARKFRTSKEARSVQLSHSYGGKFATDSTALANCVLELKTFQDEYKLKFTDQDDRTTLSNAYRANLEAGRKPLVEQRKTHYAAQEEVRHLTSALPYK